MNTQKQAHKHPTSRWPHRILEYYEVGTCILSVVLSNRKHSGVSAESLDYLVDVYGPKPKQMAVAVWKRDRDFASILQFTFHFMERKKVGMCNISNLLKCQMEDLNFKGLNPYIKCINVPISNITAKPCYRMNMNCWCCVFM